MCPAFDKQIRHLRFHNGDLPKGFIPCEVWSSYVLYFCVSVLEVFEGKFPRVVFQGFPLVLLHVIFVEFIYQSHRGEVSKT